MTIIQLLSDLNLKYSAYKKGYTIDRGRRTTYFKPICNQVLRSKRSKRLKKGTIMRWKNTKVSQNSTKIAKTNESFSEHFHQAVIIVIMIVIIVVYRSFCFCFAVTHCYRFWIHLCKMLRYWHIKRNVWRTHCNYLIQPEEWKMNVASNR